MDLEEYSEQVWRAGEMVTAGIYLRVDDDSFRVVILGQDERLPASYDGHVAHYCRAPAMCLINAQPASSDTLSRNQPGK
jgi:hypothetical protein